MAAAARPVRGRAVGEGPPLPGCFPRRRPPARPPAHPSARAEAAPCSSPQAAPAQARPGSEEAAPDSPRAGGGEGCEEAPEPPQGRSGLRSAAAREDPEPEALFRGSARARRPGGASGGRPPASLAAAEPEEGRGRGSLRPRAWAARLSSVTVPQPFGMTLRDARRRSRPSGAREAAAEGRPSREEAECLRQFRAQPAPAHVHLPLYREMAERRRPFSSRAAEAPAPAPAERAAPRGSRKVPPAVRELRLGDRLQEAELFRKIRIQMRAQDLLESSCAPIELGNRKKEKESRIASRNREQRLGFLQDNFSFRPRINTSVPDFEGLYWAFQREALSRRELKGATCSKPFKLRTSNLRCKHHVPNQETMESQQPSKTPVQRSRSLTCLSSLSSNTLPVHITDAVRKRESAIKLCQENKEYKENEGVRWAELQRKKSQAMQKSVNCRAKAMDPHKSLEDTHKEKLIQHWQNDRRKTKEYNKELEEMKMRVKNRPYLFEQITKHGACQEAQRLFRDTLLQLGLNEEFVRKKGEAPDLVRKEQSDSQRAHKFQKDSDAGMIQQLFQDGQREQELT
ncbi:protein FAM161B [Tiliqua scincoides]|uniref:protein FAM161B n=1 Tax=Tiliqua scincoides TaxID=71010 RepID=UPI0034635011